MSPDHTVACDKSRPKLPGWYTISGGFSKWVFDMFLGLMLILQSLWFDFSLIKKYSKNCNIIKYLLQFQITVVYLNIF